MLKVRVIPIVLIDGFSVLKTINFKARRNLGSPITVLKTYNSRNVDELIILDIDSSKDSRDIDTFTIKDITKECFMPVTIGGGIDSIDKIQRVLEAGADKASINKAALSNPDFVTKASSIFGSQCIVISIDYTRTKEGCFVYDHTNSGVLKMKLTKWAKQMEVAGAGELLINSIDKDGVMNGFDIDAITAVANEVNIPVISAGGAANPNSFVEATSAGASAVAGSSIFHFTKYTPNDCSNVLNANGYLSRTSVVTMIE